MTSLPPRNFLRGIIQTLPLLIVALLILGFLTVSSGINHSQRYPNSNVLGASATNDAFLEGIKTFFNGILDFISTIFR